MVEVVEQRLDRRTGNDERVPVEFWLPADWLWEEKIDVRRSPRPVRVSLAGRQRAEAEQQKCCDGIDDVGVHPPTELVLEAAGPGSGDAPMVGERWIGSDRGRPVQMLLAHGRIVDTETPDSGD